MTLQEFLNRYDYDPQKDCIGEGGFGSVYKAYDNVLDREVAIKISAVRHIGDKTFSLKTECETALSLPPHPNIACYDSVYTYQLPTGTSDFAIIQYYPDGSLKGLIASGQLSPTQREELLWALLDGLEHLHRHSIIHRDLKPANILIAKRMRGGDCVYIPKIADFGLSKAVNEQNSHISSSFAGGTLEYSSPEQLQGKPLRYNTDLWSWAVIAYEVLTGEKLFQAPNNSSAFAEGGLVDLIFSEDFRSKISLLDEPWHSLVVACLERKPEQRVRDVVALKQLLLTEEDPEPAPDPQPEPPLPPTTDPTEVTLPPPPVSPPPPPTPPTPPQEEKTKKVSWFERLKQSPLGLVLSLGCIIIACVMPVMTIYGYYYKVYNDSDTATRWIYSLINFGDIELPIPLLASVVWGLLVYLGMKKRSKLWLSLTFLSALAFVGIFILMAFANFALGEDRWVYGSSTERINLHIGYYVLLLASVASMVSSVQLWKKPHQEGWATKTLLWIAGGFASLVLIWQLSGFIGGGATSSTELSSTEQEQHNTLAADTSRNNEYRVYPESSTQETNTEASTLVEAWNDLHNQHTASIGEIEEVFAEKCKFYQSWYTTEVVRKAKEGLFKKYPQFYQYLSDISYTSTTPRSVRVEFNKHVSVENDGNYKIYPSYLVLKQDNGQWRIVEESDYITDEILRKRKP